MDAEIHADAGRAPAFRPPAFRPPDRPDAAERQAKVRLALTINAAIAERSPKQRDAAALLGCVQPEISAIANLRLAGFSVGRLMEFLTALDRDVEIGIRRRRGPGSIRVRHLENRPMVRPPADRVPR